MPAENQARLVEAWEEAGWPRRFDDPLPPTHDVDAKTRLRNTLKRLNRHQVHCLLHFAGDGTGRCAIWTAIGS